jgi:hypothetical protein
MSFLGFGSTQASKAQPYFNQAADVSHQYLDPYVQQGQATSQQLGSHNDMLMNDPQGYFSQILQGYKPSTGYDYQSKKLLQTAQNAASAGGYSGTPHDMRDQTELVNGLMGQDFQQYYNNIMGIHDQGLQGNQQIANQGYGASNELAQSLGNNLYSQGNLAYQNAGERDEMNSKLFQLALKAAGYGFGGVPGGMAADQAINLFSAGG